MRSTTAPPLPDLTHLGEAELVAVAGEALRRVTAPGVHRILDEAIDRLGTQVLGGAVSDTEVVDAIAALHRAETRLHAEKLARIAEADRRQAHRAHGARTTTDLLAQRLRIGRGEAKALVATAQAMTELPEVADALAHGHIGAGQARATGRKWQEIKANLDDTDAAAPQDAEDADTDAGADAAGDAGAGNAGCGPEDRPDPPRLEEVREDFDAFAASEGRKRDPRDLHNRLDGWAAQHDADFLADRERRNHVTRKAAHWTRDGKTIINAELAEVAGAKFDAVMGALSRPHGKDDHRDLNQRRADAIEALCDIALASDQLPQVAYAPPRVLLHTSRDALAGDPDATPSHLDGIGPVSAATANQICCDADITDVLVDPDTGVRGVSERRKTPTAKQRDYVIARDQRCIGCGAPASRCQIHHIHWRRHGGKTLVDNLTLVCWGCHHSIHHHNWPIDTHPDGRPTLHRPHHLAHTS
jgi:hypothetical protein